MTAIYGQLDWSGYSKKFPAVYLTSNLNRPQFNWTQGPLIPEKFRLLGIDFTIKGDDIYIEYYEKYQYLGQGSLSIKEVIHGYRTEKDFTKALGSSGDCNLDVNCPIGTDLDPLKEELKRSVAMMISGGSGFCSGALVNNTANDGTPYFLTANHCYSNPSTWAFRFNWISTNTVCAQTTNSISNTK